ncbi:GNAT family N-acetyltransferase [Methylocystis sp. 9N]|uniref:GNAT family N-acetyltransferase n=1 Tax=Methylocystis borbori TaxID=3118750 RepID=A0ABU7XFL1_9HYPH
MAASTSAATRKSRPSIRIRLYDAQDREFVRRLFIAVNRQLAPAHLKSQFEIYIARALVEEIERIPEYYAERAGSFWIAETVADNRLVGMYGLEAGGSGAAELRRMYVAPAFRRQGIARQMLAHAESTGKAAGYDRIVLSTSELQKSALALYRSVGFSLVAEETADRMSHKVVGAGLRRHHMAKKLT